MVQTRYSVALSVRLLEGEAVWDDKKACYYGFHRCILETSRVLWALSYQREVKGEGAYGVWRELFVVLTVGGNRASFCPSGPSHVSLLPTSVFGCPGGHNNARKTNTTSNQDGGSFSFYNGTINHRHRCHRNNHHGL
jgi:hypothetical protein